MPSLIELQRAFGAALADARDSSLLVPFLQGSPDLALKRLAVYRANVNSDSAKALAAAYPVVRRILGEEFFDALAHEYARAYPSQSGDLNAYGAHMGAFLRSFAHTQDLPYLPDLAHIEGCVHRAYYAADDPRFDLRPIEGLRTEALAELRPALAPACALLESPWPLARLWAVHQDDYDGPLEVDLLAGPERVLVHRPGWRPKVLSLGVGDFRFLECAQAGAPLGAALEAALCAERGFDATGALAHWVKTGVIAKLDLAWRREG